MEGTKAGAANRVLPRELSDWLLASGRHWITTAEAARLMSVPALHVAPTVAKQVAQHRLFSPTKGLYVAIPPAFRTWGAVPASHFIDALMGHLGHPYYVCLLSAAEHHGFAHQQPLVFQVMTGGRIRSRSFGRVHLDFIYSSRVQDRRTDRVNTPTGTMVVSSLETTVLDLVSYPARSGALYNVATIIGEMLAENAIDIDLLARDAVDYPTSVAQRTGWLIDFMAGRLELEFDSAPLLEIAARRQKATPLDPFYGQLGDLDGRWNVLVYEPPEEEGS